MASSVTVFVGHIFEPFALGRAILVTIVCVVGWPIYFWINCQCCNVKWNLSKIRDMYTLGTTMNSVLIKEMFSFQSPYVAGTTGSMDPD